MTHGAAPVDPETLLANTGWVRGLARQLLGDAARADDVVQATLLAALEHPPQAGVPLRPWLARVARNLSFQTMRSERRRRAHEAVAAAAFAGARAAPVAPDDSAARTDEFLAVVGEVRALEPIYRDVVILRFLDELEMDQVAARLGVPVETARTRLKRALAMLRERLDRRHGGDGRAWALALVPVAGGRDGWITGLATGGLVMAATTKTVVISAAVGALLGALLTAGAMTAAESAGEAPEETSSAVAPRGDGAPAASPDRPRGGAASAARDTSDARRAAAPSAERGETLAAWLDGIHVDLPAPGTGAITGHVLSKDGKPVAGAVVRARMQQPGGSYRRGGAAPAPASVESLLHAAAVNAKWEEGTRREAVTDASGAYAFTELPDMTCAVSAWVEGHDLRTAPGSNYSVKPGTTVDFVASPILTVPVTVVAADGTTPEKAMIRWSVPPVPGRGGGGGGGSSSWWTAADPMVQLEPGTWSFYAETGPDVRSQPVTATVGAGSPSEPIVLKLAGRNVIRGVVTFDPADRDWVYATVTARRRGAPDDEDELRFSVRNPDWRYELRDVKPGDYDVSVSINDLLPLISVLVRVTGGPAEQALVVPKLTASEVLEVRVTAADGGIVADEDIALQINSWTGRTGGSSAVRTVRRADGVFLVPLAGSDAAAHRRVSLGRRARGGGTADDDAIGVTAGPAKWFIQVARKVPGTKGYSPWKDFEFVPGTTTRLDIQLE